MVRNSFEVCDNICKNETELDCTIALCKSFNVTALCVIDKLVDNFFKGLNNLCKLKIIVFESLDCD